MDMIKQNVEMIIFITKLFFHFKDIGFSTAIKRSIANTINIMFSKYFEMSSIVSNSIRIMKDASLNIAIIVVSIIRTRDSKKSETTNIFIII